MSLYHWTRQERPSLWPPVELRTSLEIKLSTFSILYVPGWGWVEGVCLSGAMLALPCLNDARSNFAFPLRLGTLGLALGFLGASGLAGLRPRGL
jgi:hypothetical protein